MKQIIHQLEQSLFDPATRHSALELNKLIADEFSEVGSNGRVYTKKYVLEHLPYEAQRNFVIDDFKVMELSQDVMLATYIMTADSIQSLRSSIWKRYGDDWQMVFHQGTKCAG